METENNEIETIKVLARDYENNNLMLMKISAKIRANNQEGKKTIVEIVDEGITIDGSKGNILEQFNQQKTHRMQNLKKEQNHNTVDTRTENSYSIEHDDMAFANFANRNHQVQQAEPQRGKVVNLQEYANSKKTRETINYVKREEKKKSQKEISGYKQFETIQKLVDMKGKAKILVAGVLATATVLGAGAGVTHVVDEHHDTKKIMQEYGNNETAMKKKIIEKLTTYYENLLDEGYLQVDIQAYKHGSLTGSVINISDGVTGELKQTEVFAKDAQRGGGYTGENKKLGEIAEEYLAIKDGDAEKAAKVLADTEEYLQEITALDAERDMDEER